jgi:hypothetical protein
LCRATLNRGEAELGGGRAGNPKRLTAPLRAATGATFFCWGVPIAAGLAAMLAGCGAPKESGPLAEGKFTPAQASRVRVSVQPLGDVPNSGLLLPVVSPDGRRIAYLKYAGSDRPELDSLFTGRGIDGLSLHVETLGAGQDAARLVAPSRAGWPAWSADGERLFFVSYDDSSRASICVYSVREGAVVRRTSPGKRSAAMPAVSPNGRRVAFVAPGAGEMDFRAHVLDPDSGAVETCPASISPCLHAWCQWDGDESVVFVEASKDGAWLVHWSPGQTPPVRLAPLNVSGSLMGVFQACAAVASPLAPGGGSFAYYDSPTDRIVIVKLADGARTELPQGTRAGCWLDGRRFAAASSTQLSLVAPDAPSALLMRGQWLPRGSGAEAGELVACARGANPWTLGLARLTVITAESR